MSLWKRQIAAIIRTDLGRTFFARRGLWIYLLALGPAVPMFLHGFFVPAGVSPSADFGQDVQAFAGIFQFFYLRIAIFFGCVGIFMNLIRGEMIDKSLHYYLLAPVRRDVLLAGKFLSGLIAAIAIFCGSVLIQWAAIFWHHPAELLRSYILGGPGLSHLASYLVAAALASLGYGSVFLWAGVRYRNPLIPAALILSWEGANGILPELLKKVSVIYWLKSICPISVPLPRTPGNNILSLLVFDINPAPARIAILNLLLLAGFVLVCAAMRARRLEINYGSD